jgi:hypothetical protein
MIKKFRKKDISMDQINSWLVGLHEQIGREVELTDEDNAELEAYIYGNISNYLERYFDYPGYNNYN